MNHVKQQYVVLYVIYGIIGLESCISILFAALWCELMQAVLMIFFYVLIILYIVIAIRQTRRAYHIQMDKTLHLLQAGPLIMNMVMVCLGAILSTYCLVLLAKQHWNNNLTLIALIIPLISCGTYSRYSQVLACNQKVCYFANTWMYYVEMKDIDEEHRKHYDRVMIMYHGRRYHTDMREATSRELLTYLPSTHLKQF